VTVAAAIEGALTCCGMVRPFSNGKENTIACLLTYPHAETAGREEVSVASEGGPQVRGGRSVDDGGNEGGEKKKKK